MFKTKLFDRRYLMGAVAASALLAAATQGHALVIMPYFDSSITGAANAAQIEGRINTALSFYNRFTNDATVKIVFQIGDTGLGQNASTLYGPFAAFDYESVLAANAAAHPENTVLAGALAHINDGNGASNPQVLALSANLRALGLDAPGAFGTDGSFGAGGDYDAIITLSDAAGRIAYGNTVPDGEYGANEVIQHETDEVLGFGGAGSLVGQDFGLGFPVLGIEDLYRYDGVGVGSFTTDTSDPAYLSLDGGVTNIVNLNQNGLGDYGDFAKTVCHVGDVEHVQDWAGCPAPVSHQFGLTLTSPEVLGLQAIGYNLAVPEPSTWTLAIAGFGMVGGMLRRRRMAVA